ncbi:MAG: PcfJ domain-containing protein [Pseudomonadota bacterium]
MAKRKKKRLQEQIARQREFALERHLWDLGLFNHTQYLNWCRENGFSASLEKSELGLKRELRFHKTTQAHIRLSQGRRSRRPNTVIQQVCLGHVDPDDVGKGRLRHVVNAVAKAAEKKKERMGLSRFLAFIGENTKLLTASYQHRNREVYFIDALLALFGQSHKWIRPIQDWRCQTHNRDRQFASLARHLLVKYSVPIFFDSVWFRSDSKVMPYRQWYFLLGNGHRLKSVKAPITLTTKIIHHMLQAPDHFSVEQALRWGQVHALGGDARLAQAIVATRLGGHFGQDEFWQSVIRFFVRHPLLDRDQVAPIIDYLQHQRFEPADVVLEHGVRRLQPPPQPNLSMSGRTPGALLRQMHTWHVRLGRTKVDSNLHWSPTDIVSLTLSKGREEKKVTWRITELLSHRDLVSEGRALKHCVASYARSCQQHHCSIWGMTSEDAFGSIRRRQTVEVTRNRRIVQCRGKMNALPTSQELQVLKEWAKVAGLSIAHPQL